MKEVFTTPEFRRWLNGIRDQRAAAKIKARLIQFEGGSFGDWKPLKQGLLQSRIHYGPGYRMYFVTKGVTVIVVLGGGTKRTQRKDINTARRLAEQWRVDDESK